MNIQQLRQSVKIKWLSYYEENRSWLVKVRVWGTYNNLRRPLSGFILATLSVLEPEFARIISFILDLNDNPDEIVAALGLNFNPEQELHLIKSESSPTTTEVEAVPVVTPAQITANTPQLHQPAPLSLGDTQVTTHPTPNTVTADVPPQGFTVAVASPPPSQNLPRHHRRSPSPLAMTINLPKQTKTITSSKVRDWGFHHLPIKFCSLLLQINCLTGILFLCEYLKSPVSHGNYGKIPPKPKSNRRLANWVDEFCQGSEYDPQQTTKITKSKI
ncbi:DUF5331 domain-containing protein [Chrysosporum bergii ANA360D]|jgi:hypothetical protein|uniref:DUF5331 domain-containing protein n=1 Tax=Chrysosporum bergii ANA360D TaxID=617107 RepID=A0AA43GTU6_9CYAN|nr:DUF5331 domain-containing protein [Chrysosporum bergii]MDH6061310.1 DUF5331 domain-containing protein [Chrysosporum bergii ANA360D]